MGRVIFLNQIAKEYHQTMGITIKNPPELKLITGLSTDQAPPKRTKKAAKGKRQTMGQRIYESLKDKDPNGIA
jgi:hypothetical protein